MWYSFSASTEASVPAVLSLIEATVGTSFKTSKLCVNANYGGAAITVEYTQLEVCIIETGWGLTTINSSPKAHNYLEGALHWFLLAQKEA